MATPSGGQIDGVGASVAIQHATLHQARLGEAVNQARDIAFGDMQAVSKGLLADPFAIHQGGEHIALRDGQMDLAQALADGGGHSPMKTDQSKPDAVRIRMVSGVHESASNIFSNLLLVKLKCNLWLITLGYTPKLYMPYRPLSFLP